MKETIKRLRELYEKATPEGWNMRPMIGGTKKLNLSYISVPNSAFIAEAYNTMPALLDRLEKLEKVAEEARYVRTVSIGLNNALQELDRSA